jgi:hypothetical protein
MQRVYLFASVKSTYPSQILVDPTLHPAMIIYPQMPQISQIEFDPFFKSVQSAKSVDRLCCGSAALTLRVASGFSGARRVYSSPTTHLECVSKLTGLVGRAEALGGPPLRQPIKRRASQSLGPPYKKAK